MTKWDRKAETMDALRKEIGAEPVPTSALMVLVRCDYETIRVALDALSARREIVRTPRGYRRLPPRAKSGG